MFRKPYIRMVIKISLYFAILIYSQGKRKLPLLYIYPTLTLPLHGRMIFSRRYNLKDFNKLLIK